MSTDGRITVLHFSNATIRAGAEEHMLLLLRRLNRAKFRPLLACHPTLIEAFGDDLPTDINVVPVTLEGPADIVGALRLERVLKKDRVDIVHSHMFQASRLASPIARLAGVPVTVETPHVREHWRRGWIKGSFIIDRLVGRFVTRYIAVSNANRDYLLRDKRLPPGKVTVVRNGINPARFKFDTTPSEDVLRKFGISSDAPLIGVLARLEPQKGHRVLLDAWRTVSSAFPEARLLFLGDGSLREELKTRATRLRIDGSIVFAGYQRNVAEWLALMRFTVLPSFYEGLPLSPLESLAAGRAVVATAVDGTTEVVIDGETGLLVPPGEPDPLSEAICRLIASPALARDLGCAGRKMVRGHFSEERQVEETEIVYESALRQRQHWAFSPASRSNASAPGSERIELG